MRGFAYDHDFCASTFVGPRADGDFGGPPHTRRQDVIDLHFADRETEGNLASVGGNSRDGFPTLAHLIDFETPAEKSAINRHSQKQGRLVLHVGQRSYRFVESCPPRESAGVVKRDWAKRFIDFDGTDVRGEFSQASPDVAAESGDWLKFKQLSVDVRIVSAIAELVGGKSLGVVGFRV